MNKFKNLDKTSILEAIEVKDNKTFSRLLRYLGCDPRNGNENRLLRDFLKDNNIDFFQLKDTITPIINQEQCNTVCTFRSLAMLFRIITNNDDYMGTSQYRKLKILIEKNKLDVSHIRKYTGGDVSKRYDDSEVFCKDSEVSTQTLKVRYIKSGVDYVCNICNISEWLGDKITLELDHIDGDNTNNCLDNLRLLCPNCHSQTETFSGKNKRKC